MSASGVKYISPYIFILGTLGGAAVGIVVGSIILGPPK
jgi:hypothetical protein